MDGQGHHLQLIGNRFGAIIAVCITGFLAVGELRFVFSGAPYKSGWLIPIDSLPLPIWAVITLNIWFYTAIIWLGVWAYRGTHGNERVIVAGFFVGILLIPIKALVSTHLITAVRLAQALGMSVAFFAALVALWKSPAFGKSDAKTVIRLLLFLGALFVLAFVVGAVVYFTGR